MPELGGLDVARLVKAGALPAIAFVTAFDEFAVEAFELNAVDYLLKPVEAERLAGDDRSGADAGRRARPPSGRARCRRRRRRCDAATRRSFLERIPVRERDEVLLLPVRQIASIVAEGELLHLTTIGNERYTIAYRLHALEARLDPRRFVRLGRGTLAAVDLIQRFSPMPGGTYQVTLGNGQQLQASRIQSQGCCARPCCDCEWGQTPITTVTIPAMRTLLAGAAALTLALTMSQSTAAAQPELIARAKALHAQVPLIDGHNDYPWALREHRPGARLRQGRHHQDGAGADDRHPAAARGRRRRAVLVGLRAVDHAGQDGGDAPPSSRSRSCTG